MRRFGVIIGAAGVVGGCQWIAGVEDAVPYSVDGGTSTGSSGEGGGEATTCTPGTAKECYSGEMATKGVGICLAGKQTCRMDGAGYEEGCAGEVTPKGESCAAGADENCDGYDCVQWAGLFGDTGEQVARSITVDATGNSFVVGYFSGVIPFGTDVRRCARRRHPSKRCHRCRRLLWHPRRWRWSDCIPGIEHQQRLHCKAPRERRLRKDQRRRMVDDVWRRVELSGDFGRCSCAHGRNRGRRRVQRLA